MGQPNQPGWPAAPPTVALYIRWASAGHVAQGQIKRDGEEGKWLATAALILGYLQLAATVGVVLVAAILGALGAQ